MNIHPCELRDRAYDRQQQLIDEAQACAASQRRMMQRLRSVLNWLGDQFVCWGEWLQPQSQRIELQRK